MPDEYISREAALMKLMQDGCNAKNLQSISDMPAADVAPVVHGKWISLTECANEGVYCSICKKKVWKSDYAWCSKRSTNKLRSNYCPNCGAKMDGGDGNSDICSKTI